MARIPRGKFGTEFLSDEQERQVLRFVRTLGLRHPELERALTGLFDAEPLEWVAYEHASVANYRHAQIQLAMVGMLHLFAHKHDVTLLGIYPATAKKVLTGSGKAKKPAMLAAARALHPELNIFTDDEADALAVGLAFFSKVELTQDV